MTLFHLARKNIRKDFKNYFLYFASMTFSIVIYFTFISLKYTDTIVQSAEASTKIQAVFNAASLVLLIFVAIFIGYSNAFFTRTRKKEIGLYALLGVRKKQIGRMLFYENFLMGLASLFVGILMGSMLSKFFVTLLLNVMGHAAIASFAVSLKAIVHTLFVFVGLTIITSIHGYRLIYRYRLIELFRADKEKEEQPKASFVVASFAVLLLAFGYYLALENILESTLWQKIGFLTTPIVILLSVILGTYLLFNTVIVYLLNRMRQNKKRFWRGTNLISTSQLLYRMRGNARTLTVIAILSATTLTAVGASYSLYYNTKENAEITNPNSLMFTSEDSVLNKQVEKAILQADEHLVHYHKSVPYYKVSVDTSKLNNHMGEVRTNYSILSNTVFNQLAELQNQKDRFDLQADEAVVLDVGYYEGLSPKYVGDSIPIEIGERKAEVQFIALKEYNVVNVGTAGITVVVSDKLFESFLEEEPALNFELYQIEKQEDANDLDQKLKAILPEEARYTSFYEVYAAGLETSGLLIFIGAFLGLVFIAATGSIIYFKQLTEANADKERYHVLYKMGVNKKEIRQAISKQVFVVFTLPLMLGLMHSAVALTALSRLLQTSLIVPIIFSTMAYVMIYVGYYFLTVQTYYKIVTR